MGVSTNGVLIYGIPFDPDEDELPDVIRAFHEDADEDEDEPFEEFDDVIIARESDLPAWLPDMTGEETTEYYFKRREFLENHPAKLEIFCSYDYPMYMLRPNISRAKWTAHRGYCTEVPERLDQLVPDEAVAALKAWCEQAGVPWREPQWLLVSMWG